MSIFFCQNEAGEIFHSCSSPSLLLCYPHFKKIFQNISQKIFQKYFTAVLPLLCLSATLILKRYFKIFQKKYFKKKYFKKIFQKYFTAVLPLLCHPQINYSAKGKVPLFQNKQCIVWRSEGVLSNWKFRRKWKCQHEHNKFWQHFQC